MEVFITFVAVIGATIGFMYLLIKVCMLMGGSRSKDDPADAAKPADKDAAAHHP